MALADTSGGPLMALPSAISDEVPSGKRLDRERFHWGSITLLAPRSCSSWSCS